MPVLKRWDATGAAWEVVGGISGGGSGGGVVLSFTDAGGVGDGTTDNTAAFNAALATLATTGGQLFFPAGVYKINGTTDPVPGGVWLVGTGYDYHTPSSSGDRPARMSVIKAGAAMTRLIQLGDDATVSTSGETGASIRHLVIDGAGVATTAVKTAARRNVISECQVGYATSKGVDMAGQNGRISFSVIDQAGVGDCVHVHAYNDNKVLFSQIRQPGTTGAGVRIEDVSMVDVLGNHIWAGQNGVAAAAEGLVVVSGDCRGVLIQNNTIEGVNGPEVYLKSPTGTEIRDLLISGNRFYMAGGTADNTYPVISIGGGPGTIASANITGNIIEGVSSTVRYKSLVDVASVLYTLRILIANNVGSYVAALTTGTAPNPLTQAGNIILNGSATRYSDNKGRETFNGTGAQTAFAIPHLLDGAPTTIQVTPGSSGAASSHYVTADATNITVTFSTAPASGTGNVVLNWRASL